MATDANDKLLVASVIERGERDIGGDVVRPEQEDEIGAPRGLGGHQGAPGRTFGRRWSAW